MITYRIDSERVDPVFYPVVPDSFMARGGGLSVADRRYSDVTDWPEETGQGSMITWSSP